jgi:hypothetical protein
MVEPGWTVAPWLPEPGLWDFSVLGVEVVPPLASGGPPRVDVTVSIDGIPFGGHRLTVQVPQDAAAGLDQLGVREIGTTEEVAADIDRARPLNFFANLVRVRSGKLLLDPSTMRAIR